MGHHGVDVSARHQKAEARSAEDLEGVGGTVVWLSKNGDPVTRVLQYARNDGNPEGGMIYIGVPADIYKIRFVPTESVHFLAGNGQKAACGVH